MAQIIKEITIDVAKRTAFRAMLVKQFDWKSRLLKVTINNEGVKLPIVEGSYVILNAKRPDGRSNGFMGEVNPDGTVTVPLAVWLLEVCGIVYCDISIVDNDTRQLSTISFSLEVEELMYDGCDLPDDDNYGILITLVGEVNIIKTETETARDEANRAAGEADEAADGANTAADRANTAAEKIEDAIKAENVTYENDVSGLTAVDVQGAIDEISSTAGIIDDASTVLNRTWSSNKIDSVVSGIKASDVPYDNEISGLIAEDTQGAIDEVVNELDGLIDDTATAVDTTWSSSKLNGILGDIDSALIAILGV